MDDVFYFLKTKQAKKKQQTIIIYKFCVFPVQEDLRLCPQHVMYLQKKEAALNVRDKWSSCGIDNTDTAVLSLCVFFFFGLRLQELVFIFVIEILVFFFKSLLTVFS